MTSEADRDALSSWMGEIGYWATESLADDVMRSPWLAEKLKQVRAEAINDAIRAAKSIPEAPFYGYDECGWAAESCYQDAQEHAIDAIRALMRDQEDERKADDESH